jgi:hypothetical protein
MPTPLCVFDNPDVTGIGVRTAIWVQALLIGQYPPNGSILT